LADLPEIYLATGDDWRDWLAENHATTPGVWLIYFKKHTGEPRVSYDDAVSQALCFGWIDSTVRRLDNARYAQKFVPRRERSGWSGHNRRRAEELIASGEMTDAGMAKIDAARANGLWERALADRVDRPVPKELTMVLEKNPEARAAFKRLSPTRAKYLKAWVAEAKMAATRERRAAKAVTMLLAEK